MRSNSSLALKVDVTKVYTSLALLTAMNMEEEEVFGGAQKASKCSFSSRKMHYFFSLVGGGVHSYLYEYMCLLPRVDFKSR